MTTSENELPRRGMLWKKDGIPVIDGLTFSDNDQMARLSTSMRHYAANVREDLRDATRRGHFPVEIYREMGARGWLAPFASVTDGGIGGGVAEYCAVAEEVAFSGLVSPQIAIQGQRWLLDWGTTTQRERYLGPISRGEVVFSESISEPGVGSSLKEIQATARRDGTDWVLQGRKTHVNLGHQSDVTLMYAMAEEGLTAFLVDTNLPGFSSHETAPIGGRMLPTADMVFDDVRVPESAVLGEAGVGMSTFFSTFNISRLGNASEAIGTARRALSLAVTYAKGRRVGAHHVTDFQGIQWILADRFSDLYAASMVRDRAAAEADAGHDPAFETSLAKKLAIEAAERTTNDVFALTGGHGLYFDEEFGQLLHDVKVMRIGGGSLEVLRNHVARRVLRSPAEVGL